ncbi:solute carrier family 23 protein [Bacillus velezensis]|nr:solute carrier family 23 protein [Bacillus velezensis]
MPSFTGILSLIPVLIGIIGGYLFALTQGIVNFQPVIDAKWFAVPEFIIPFKDYTPSVTLGIAVDGAGRFRDDVRTYRPPNGAE